MVCHQPPHQPPLLPFPSRNTHDTQKKGANVMDVLAAEVLVLSRPALEALTARLLP